MKRCRRYREEERDVKSHAGLPICCWLATLCEMYDCEKNERMRKFLPFLLQLLAVNFSL